MTKKINNKLVASIFLIICVLLLVSTSMPSFTYADESTTFSTITTFIEKYNLQSCNYTVKNIQDFSNNTFKLYEFSDKAYAICTDDLVLSKYPYQKDDKSSDSKKDKAWHNVVAYGYNKDMDTFVVNYGWSPSNGTNYNSVILSNYTVYAYYAMEFNGEHVHSKNGIGLYTIGNSTFVFDKCGCSCHSLNGIY